MKDCIQCLNPINAETLSFEQRLIDDQDFCRKCFEEAAEGDGLAYLDNSRFLTSNR